MRSSGPLRLSGYGGGRCWRLVGVAEGRGTPKGRGASGGGRKAAAARCPEDGSCCCRNIEDPAEEPAADRDQRLRELRPGPDGRRPRRARTAHRSRQHGATGDRGQRATWSSDASWRWPAPDDPDIAPGPRARAEPARGGEGPGQRAVPQQAKDPANVAFSRTRRRAPGRGRPPPMEPVGPLGRRRPKEPGGPQPDARRGSAPDGPPTCRRWRAGPLGRPPKTRAGQRAGRSAPGPAGPAALRPAGPAAFGPRHWRLRDPRDRPESGRRRHLARRPSPGGRCGARRPRAGATTGRSTRTYRGDGPRRTAEGSTSFEQGTRARPTQRGERRGPAGAGRRSWDGAPTRPDRGRGATGLPTARRPPVPHGTTRDRSGTRPRFSASR